MQAITALAHLHATILFFFDPSEQCGYSLQQQVALFHSIKPLFANKPLIAVANKTDLKTIDDLDSADRTLVDSMLGDRPNAQLLSMSNHSTEGVNKVLQAACDLLLAHRVAKKLASKRANELVNRIQVTQPVKRDDKDRSINIPASVLKRRQEAAEASMDAEDDSADKLFNKDFRRVVRKEVIDPLTGEKRKLERDLEAEHGGAGIYEFDLKKHYTLANSEWKYDVIPEIMDGKNIADFIDADIEAQLAQLEAEEEELMASYQVKRESAMDEEDDDSELDEDEYETLKEKKSLVMAEKLLRRTNNKPVLPRSARARSTTLGAVADTLGELGRDSSRMRERSQSRVRSRTPLPTLRDTDPESQPTQREGRGRKRSRSDMDTENQPDADDAEMDPKKRALSKIRARSLSRDRSAAHRIAAPSPFRDASQKRQASKLKHVQAERKMNRNAKKGEADRHHYDEKPKHLFSGKRGMGKTDRR